MLHSGLLLICKILSEVGMRCDDSFTHPRLVVICSWGWIADVIAIALFFIIIKFIKYLRVIPHWGPMLLAVVDTMRDSAVLLYLLVLLALQLACAFAFHIAFGGENNHFSTMSRSFISMFRMVGWCVACGFVRNQALFEVVAGDCGGGGFAGRKLSQDIVDAVLCRTHPVLARAW
jgi:hypothetical protein